MGINAASIYNANSNISAIDKQALAKVKEQIFNPTNDKTVDVSKLDLSKFNRVSLGTDLYAERTNADVILKASKAATDFGVKFSQEFNTNIQYLNSQAAQSLLTVKENTPAAISIENTNQVISEQNAVASASKTSETQDLNKDRRGSNPFSFYTHVEKENEQDDNDSIFGSINIFA